MPNESTVTQKSTGGPAFPRSIGHGSIIDTRGDEHAIDVRPQAGMTLRDYFAGQALVGIATRFDADAKRRYLTAHADGREAKIAYLLADAMLAERTKGGA